MAKAKEKPGYILNAFRGQMALRIVTRRKYRNGTICEVDRDNIMAAIRNDACFSEINDAISFAMGCDGFKPKAFIDILNWLIDNWERIFEIIMAIIMMFAGKK